MNKHFNRLTVLSGLGHTNSTAKYYDQPLARKVIPNGCQIYNICGEEILAINEYSAVRKYAAKPAY